MIMPLLFLEVLEKSCQGVFTRYTTSAVSAMTLAERPEVEQHNPPVSTSHKTVKKEPVTAEILQKLYWF